MERPAFVLEGFENDRDLDPSRGLFNCGVAPAISCLPPGDEASCYPIGVTMRDEVTSGVRWEEIDFLEKKK